MDIDQLREICLSFPGATEEIKWENNLTFLVGGKMFCIVDLDDPEHPSFKVPWEDFDQLCESGMFRPAPYLARAGWVQLEKPSALGRKVLGEMLGNSFEMIRSKLPKRLRDKGI
ncbi:MmcQ/YjbR family DNA-binding protein [Flavihumibacter rivuli]|uniref:MmcQ/YjbR family DNA-binding protein n=1 Tax=Flavihumibacter rivuli TaxID=2838156 RepID=UPI001BDEBE72|nr:MmcQ/YjbR family DNA-binding protein [Flavihumibacter rivuli]ULQ57645.1 MmcQ/YjbR family DNA-binding protein [Flavihumibacter rivuli]